MIKFAKQSPSLRSGSEQGRRDCLHVSSRSPRKIGSAFLADRAHCSAGDYRHGIRFGYPEFEDLAAYDRSDRIPLHTGSNQSKHSYLKTYVVFPLRIKSFERSSEKYSL